MKNLDSIISLSESFASMAKLSSLQIDLSKVDNLGYSTIMRELVKNYDKNVVETFRATYKDFFDKEYLNDTVDFEKSALIKTIDKLKIKTTDELLEELSND